MKVGLGELIDRLVILNLKIWHMEDALRDKTRSNEEIGKITRVLTSTNEQRTAVKGEIDELCGQEQGDMKLYTKRETAVEKKKKTPRKK